MHLPGAQPRQAALKGARRVVGPAEFRKGLRQDRHSFGTYGGRLLLLEVQMTPRQIAVPAQR